MRGPARRTEPAPADDILRLFRPEGIAVVGASERPGSVGRDVVENLISRAYPGALYPVNPRYRTVLGLPAYPSLAALPSRVDLAAIAVPAAATIAAVEAAGRAGIPFALVFASGFAEAGPRGADLQGALAAAARGAGIRILGPNCQGFMNIAERLHAGFGPPYQLDYTAGNVSLVSQSGAFGNSLLIGLNQHGVGVRHYVSTGNEADLNAPDLVAAMVRDAETRAVGLYLEGLRDPARLRGLAAEARAHDTPLVVWKVGRSEAGARAAASHTASLAGDDRLYRSAFRQFGIVEAHDISDMADTLLALSTGRHARGPRVGIITVSGGAGVAMADRADACGLQLSAFAPETLDALRPLLPEFAGLGNPLDVTAGAVMDPANLTNLMRRVAADASVDMLAMAFAGATGKAGAAIAQAVAGLHRATDLPITVSWNAPRARNAEAYDQLEALGVPVYGSPARAIGGLAAIWQARGPGSVIAGPALPEAAPSRMLNEAEAKAHLDGTGMRSPKEAIVFDAEAASAAAAGIGGPVVAKLLSSVIAHKSDLGLVRLNLRGPREAAEAFTDLAAIAENLTPPLPFEGVLLQEMVTGGVETILGARIDPGFGPVILFGAGGIHAEIFEDTAIRLGPVGPEEARAMVAETKIAKLLRGARGRAPADIEALVLAIAALSYRIIAAGGTLQEVEINPLFVMERGHGVVAGDCVVRIRETAQGAVQITG